MMNDLPAAWRDADLERNAYNAAFYDLGLRWHWDDTTWLGLLEHSPCPQRRIRHYVETRHPHLLKAYEPEFLAAAIEERAARHRQCGARAVDWAQVACSEVGV